jgi:hypothetical protein
MIRIVLFLTVIVNILVLVLLVREATILRQGKVDTTQEKAVNVVRSLDIILIRLAKEDPILLLQGRVVIIRRLQGKGDKIILHQVKEVKIHQALAHVLHLLLQEKEVKTQDPLERTVEAKQNHIHHHLKAVKVQMRDPNPWDREIKTLNRQIKYPRVIKALLAATAKNP